MTPSSAQLELTADTTTNPANVNVGGNDNSNTDNVTVYDCPSCGYRITLDLSVLQLDESAEVQTSRTSTTHLGSRHYNAIQALVTASPGEPMHVTAKRAGVSKVTLWRYLQDNEFQRKFSDAVIQTLKSKQGQVAKSLVDGALRVGNGQGQLQKLYWQLLGKLVERHEVSGEIEVQIGLDWSRVDERKRDALLEIAGGRAENDDYVMLTKSEYDKLTAGTGSRAMIDVTPRAELETTKDSVDVDTDVDTDTLTPKIALLPFRE